MMAKSPSPSSPESVASNLKIITFFKNYPGAIEDFPLDNLENIDLEGKFHNKLL